MLNKIVVIGFLFFAYCFRVSSPSRTSRHVSARFFVKHRTNAAMASSSFNLSHHTHYYIQILDHFTFIPPQSQEGIPHTFQQRYLTIDEYWGGPKNNSPIFVYIGEESDIVSDKDFAGLMIQNARPFNALLLYIEHRYYGQSYPFASRRDSLRNASTLAYLTSEQALADAAIIILDLKKNLSAQNCPVIVFGCSYGGMLASWFRLKYPHISIGALASSAPILYFEDITPPDAYARIATKDFRSTSETCYAAIKSSWAEIDKLGSTPEGLANLTKIFKTCQALNSADALKDHLWNAYLKAAQYDYQLVQGICKAVDHLPRGTDVLTRISAGATFNYNYYKQQSTNCLDIEEHPPYPHVLDNLAFDWQRCTEMVMPISFPANTTMFPSEIFDMKSHAEDCWKKYGILPRPNWITTEFGGHNIRRVLKDFGSNIIFSNGLRDPYSGAGVLKSLSKSVVAFTSPEGVHCQDMRFSRPDDPPSIKKLRGKETGIMRLWIAQYKLDLLNKTKAF